MSIAPDWPGHEWTPIDVMPHEIAVHELGPLLQARCVGGPAGALDAGDFELPDGSRISVRKTMPGPALYVAAHPGGPGHTMEPVAIWCGEGGVLKMERCAPPVIENHALWQCRLWAAWTAGVTLPRLVRLPWTPIEMRGEIADYVELYHMRLANLDKLDGITAFGIRPTHQTPF